MVNQDVLLKRIAKAEQYIDLDIVYNIITGNLNDLKELIKEMAKVL